MAVFSVKIVFFTNSRKFSPSKVYVTFHLRVSLIFGGNLTHLCLLFHSNQVHGLDRSVSVHGVCVFYLFDIVLAAGFQNAVC